MDLSATKTESVLVMKDMKKMEKEYVRVSDYLYLPHHKGLRVEINVKISVCCVALWLN